MKPLKTRGTQSSPSHEPNRQFSPNSSKRKLITNSKESPNTSNQQNSNINSPEAKASPKGIDKKKSILHSQKFDRSKTLKVVFRRPSEVINLNNLQNLENLNKNLGMQRGYSIDFDINNEQNPLKLMPKAIVLYEEAKKMIKSVIKFFFYPLKNFFFF